MFKQGISFMQNALASMVRNRPADNKLGFRGMWHNWHYRGGKLLREWDTPNDIVNQGKNDILDVYFSDGTQTAASGWYGGLISLASYSALAAADTYQSHAGWTEFTGYSQATRVAWGPGNPSSQSITNASAMVFDINANGTVKGLFICTSSTKGNSGAGPILWATALYSGDVAVIIGDQIRSTYTLSC